jgi:hypothetical protein
LLWQRRQWQLWQLHTTIKLQPDAVALAAVAERCSVRRGSGSGSDGRCGSGGSGRTLQRAAGQWHWQQWITTIKMGRGRTLQRAAGQRQQWKRLSHLLWQQRQWQNAAACSGAVAVAAVAHNNQMGEQLRRQTTMTTSNYDEKRRTIITCRHVESA